MRISRPLAINVVLGVVVAGAIVGSLVLLNPFGTAASSSDVTQLTGSVQQGVVSKTISASGSIAPVRQVSASFGIVGTVATVNVTVGQTVAAGDVVGTLDTTPLDKTLASAKTTLKNARTALATAPDAQTAQAQAQVTSAQSAVNDASDALGAASLSAPISGLVTAVGSSVGQKVQAGSISQSVTPTGTSSSTSTTSSAFVTIADTSALTVTANIAEADIASVAAGQVATVSFPALGTITAPAKVTAIAPTATTSNSVVTYSTTITLDSAPAGLRLGQTAQVSITTKSSAAEALYVPAAAITTANGVSAVKVVSADGSTTTVDVTLGVVGDAGTEILTGLKAGQTVVIGTVSATQTTNNVTNQRQQRFGGGTGGGFTGGSGAPGGGFVGRTQQ